MNRFFGHKLDGVKKVSPLVSILVIVLIVGGVVGATKENIIAYFGGLLVAIFILHALGFLWATARAGWQGYVRGTGERFPSKSGCRIPDWEARWPSSILRYSQQRPVPFPPFITV